MAGTDATATRHRTHPRFAVSAPTESTVTVQDPDGNDHDITIAVSWIRERNPCDKEPSQYRGEDDGWTPESVELA